MSIGYGPAMRVFTKTEATIYIPKKKVQLSVAHVDDGYLQGKTMGMVLAWEIHSHTVANFLATERKLKIKDLCIQLWSIKNICIRPLASAIGNKVASTAAISYGPL